MTAKADVRGTEPRGDNAREKPTKKQRRDAEWGAYLRAVRTAKKAYLRAVRPAEEARDQAVRTAGEAYDRALKEIEEAEE